MTCLTQEYQDVEFIISDNFSCDNTAAIVQHFLSDSRFRYINTGKRLSMSENWEFALVAARGRFVSFIGDDDGFLPGALEAASVELATSNLGVITWIKPLYCWPSNASETSRNLLTVPLPAPAQSINCRDEIRDVISFRKGYHRLPQVYNSFVSIDLIAKLRRNGKFFNSITPDVYSGFALASIMETYRYYNFAFSLNGASGFSNGAYLSLNNATTKAAAAKFYAENTLEFHNRLVNAPSLEICVAESFLQVKDICNTINDIDIDYYTLLSSAMKTAQKSGPEHYTSVVDAVVEIGNRNNIPTERIIARFPPKSPKASIPFTAGIIPFRRGFVIDAAKYGATNIYAATLVYHFILHHGRQHYTNPIAVVSSTLHEAIRRIRMMLS